MIHKTVIIAEAGVNHNGDLALAKKLVDVAVEAGADWVKFQTFSADRQVSRAAKKADYQAHTTDANETHYEMLRRLELTESMHHELVDYCRARNVGFLSSGFDEESINFLVGLGQEYFKIPSGEITNLPYLRHIGRLDKKIILSTGMSTLGEIEEAIDAIVFAGTRRTNITILHCTTEYPAPMNEVNLCAIQSMARAFGLPVGYSDHTRGIEISIAAVAMGATIIEKHFTLDRQLPGPDHQASLEPTELKALVSSIRNVESAFGNGIKRPTPSECRNKIVARKSLVARKAILSGEIFNEQNIACKRPGSGISPMRLDEFLGRRAGRDYLMDEEIEF